MLSNMLLELSEVLSGVGTRADKDIDDLTVAVCSLDLPVK